MKIVKFNPLDTEEIVSLFYETVHSVNSKDYSQSELDAWAPRNEKESKVKSWKESLNENITYVVKLNNKIVGFSDLTHSGHLDRLYVHKEYQGKGIATALVDILESQAKKLNLLEIDTEASITAKPFFEQRGYKIICTQIVERKGVNLTNYKMIKKVTFLD
ncbi:GNAT family N-acetyltransferase [Psychrobacillus glaciei]|uniref:GNAT family N-acetyltransferase n=1 Tax=Psychrobacillus glaciei TaxID=2283160 RepID=A0A5J6SJ00_9BACI|nr:GNAT family N-acetyltransferase [Psychrobacillus glaciei]QFF97851.1 GNAT family N-acetyltransferase [Psychrobacillus glaciei]